MKRSHIHPEVRAWVANRIRNDGFRVGDRLRWFNILRREHPEWLRMPGRKSVTLGGFRHFVAKVARENGVKDLRKPHGPVNGNGVPALPPVYREPLRVTPVLDIEAQARALATVLIARVVGMAQKAESKVGTLRALEELTRDEEVHA